MSNSKELQRDKEYKATVPVFPDLYIVQRHASHNVLVQLGLEPFECPYFEQQKGVRGDNTVHIFTHFIRRTENAIREYLRNYLLSRLDYVSSVGGEYLDQIESSAEAYIDAISTPGTPLDLLGILLLSRLYRVHVAVAHAEGVWVTSEDNDIAKALFVVIYRGEYYSETCKIGQFDPYFDSLVKKTRQGVMPSHVLDMKISLLEEDTEKATEKAPVIKHELKFKPKNISVSTAAKIVAKAKVERFFAASRQDRKDLISALIHSGHLRPDEISQNAMAGRHAKSNRRIQVNCALCGADCISRRKFVIHMKQYHPTATFSCRFCGKIYQTWNSSYKHERTHTEAKSICTVCGRAFNLPAELNAHMPVHDPASKFYCETCGKGYASKGGLNRHKQLHLDLQLPCPNCVKTFKSKNRLQVHQRGMHGPGYTTHCGAFTYAWPGKRNRHQKICDTCIELYQEEHSAKFPDLTRNV